MSKARQRERKKKRKRQSGGRGRPVAPVTGPPGPCTCGKCEDVYLVDPEEAGEDGLVGIPRTLVRELAASERPSDALRAVLKSCWRERGLVAGLAGFFRQRGGIWPETGKYGVPLD